jgi:hypothetical protein
VFEEVIALPHAAVHWRLPVLLNCLAGIILFLVVADRAPSLGRIDTQRQSQVAPSTPVDALSPSGDNNDLAGAQFVGMAAIVVVGFAGTFWSALVLWLIGRLFLRARFSWLKALEIAGLTTMILALESVVTLLVIVVNGDVSARPALSLMVGGFDPANKGHQTLAALNFFHFWMASVLAVGLAKLAEVSVGEAAVWVFVLWIALRLALVVLA